MDPGDQLAEKDKKISDLETSLVIKEAVTTERNISDSRYARKITENIVFGALVIFALAALFFIFTKVGLPVPSLP